MRAHAYAYIRVQYSILSSAAARAPVRSRNSIIIVESSFLPRMHQIRRNKLEMLKLDMLHENEGRTNIFKADHFFQTKLVRGTDIFSENFGPRTVISGTNFPVTGLYNRWSQSSAVPGSMTNLPEVVPPLMNAVTYTVYWEAPRSPYALGLYTPVPALYRPRPNCEISRFVEKIC